MDRMDLGLKPDTTRATELLRQAARLEQDRSGDWRARARRQRSADRLRASAYAHAGASHWPPAVELPDDLPF
ncbi:TPA: hypothetical protein ACXNC8_002037 [Stenotrophomonas maltophilia]